MKTIKLGMVALVATLSLTACRETTYYPRYVPGTPCSSSQRGQTAASTGDGHRLTCGATYQDRVLRWR